MSNGTQVGGSPFKVTVTSNEPKVAPAPAPAPAPVQAPAPALTPAPVQPTQSTQKTTEMVAVIGSGLTTGVVEHVSEFFIDGASSGK